VFDINGYRIYWGDLTYEDIKELKGTYYVLTQKNGYYDVPKPFIKVESLKESDDPFRFSDNPLLPRDKISLDPNYVKIKAFGKIIRSGDITSFIPQEREIYATAMISKETLVKMEEFEEGDQMERAANCEE